MHFLKEKKQYFDKELHGNISNAFKFSYKELHKTIQRQQLPLCFDCKCVLIDNFCVFCNAKNQGQFNNALTKNIGFTKVYEQGAKSQQSLILCVDLSGSMNLTYPSRYKKINKDFVIRSMGQQNFKILSQMMKQNEIIKNFKSIQVLLQSGQPIKDIGYSFQREYQRTHKTKSLSTQKQSQLEKKHKFQQPEDIQYISRKQIIQIAVDRYISQIKNNSPNTYITVVYFNSNIEIPKDHFYNNESIGDLENKTIEEMIQLGSNYAKKISLGQISTINQNLMSNMMKMQPNGQTALGPAIAFCLGLAKSFKHDLHQIVVITDGLSNIGFGKTQEEKDLIQSKKIYQTLAHEYAVKYGCIINIIGFEDSAIGYQVLDQLVKTTNGLPYQIELGQQKQQKIINEDSINRLNFQIMIGFSQLSKQLCYETKLFIKVDNQKIKLSLSDQFKKFIKKSGENYILLDLGIRPIKQNISVTFKTQQQNFQAKSIKFTVINQYKRKNKINYVVREDYISVKNGDEKQAEKEQSSVVQKQIQEKLKFIKIYDQNIEDYEQIQKKIQQKNISQNIDQNILEKFQVKKQKLDENFKNLDKLTLDKKMMQSRRNETYKKRKNTSSDQQQSEDFK